jgi:hypothetical protein
VRAGASTTTGMYIKLVIMHGFCASPMSSPEIAYRILDSESVRVERAPQSRVMRHA